MSQRKKSQGSGVSGRRLGSLKGKLQVPDDFDAPLPDEVLDTFEGQAPSPSRRTWNYRVMSFKHGEETWNAIHEVHYSDGVPIAYSASEAVVMWCPEDGDGVDGGVRCLDRMREALSKPTLTEDDFPRSS